MQFADQLRERPTRAAVIPGIRTVKEYHGGKPREGVLYGEHLHALRELFLAGESSG